MVDPTLTRHVLGHYMVVLSCCNPPRSCFDRIWENELHEIMNRERRIEDRESFLTI